jgi:hypothetical protein
LAETHDTAPKKLAVAPMGATGFCDVHAVPFHPSAIGVALAVTEALPAASQAVTVAHDTPRMSALDAPAGSGICSIAHDDPFQFSPTRLRPPEPVAYPSAAQKLAETQDTPCSSVRLSPAGSGGSVPLHDVPFHASASATKTLELLTPYPTAWQKPADAHEMDSSSGLLIPAGAGVDCAVQLVPFHASANGPRLSAPTASQSSAAGHDTWSSEA